MNNKRISRTSGAMPNRNTNPFSLLSDTEHVEKTFKKPAKTSKSISKIDLSVEKGWTLAGKSQNQNSFKSNRLYKRYWQTS